MSLFQSTFIVYFPFKICKFFLDAVEKAKYGWFWECPNGERCIYRHALPQGYVLKRDKKKMDAEKGPDISLVDLIEKERNALGSATVKSISPTTSLVEVMKTVLFCIPRPESPSNRSCCGRNAKFKRRRTN